MTDAPRRRWFRFSLRSFALGITLASVVVCDYLRCYNNPKLRYGGGDFDDDMFFVIVLLAVTTFIWMAVGFRRGET